MAKYTPGPWQLQGHHGDILGAQGIFIASTWARGRLPDVALILRAPKMFETIKAVLDRCDGHLYGTDQETGETFDRILKEAIEGLE